MGHKSEFRSYKNTAARNARALQKAQEGPISVLMTDSTSEPSVL